MSYASLSLMKCEPSAEDMASLSVKNLMEREVPLGVTVTPEGLIQDAIESKIEVLKNRRWTVDEHGVMRRPR